MSGGAAAWHGSSLMNMQGWGGSLLRVPLRLPGNGSSRCALQRSWRLDACLHAALPPLFPRSALLPLDRTKQYDTLVLGVLQVVFLDVRPHALHHLQAHRAYPVVRQHALPLHEGPPITACRLLLAPPPRAWRTVHLRARHALLPQEFLHVRR
jgi:hypothetical protein